MKYWNKSRPSSRQDRIEQAWLAEARRAGAGRLPRPSRRRGGISGPPIVYIVCITLLLGWYGPQWLAKVDPSLRKADTPSAILPTDGLSADFGFCHRGGGTDCVVDGDTFWFRGEKYRIADIDTPETHGPRCEAEGALGARSTQRLQVLMNAGAFSLEIEGRDTDRYGRNLRVVTRGGQSIGEQLVAEGLARRWDGRRHPWC
ncbi:thermonuclease family protein [Sphingobium sp.]|uniref:thermonuclease family protein n=1 Tax=Sphingobium sp. TaxID=1912891 RepID=UPI003B3A77B7